MWAAIVINMEQNKDLYLQKLKEREKKNKTCKKLSPAHTESLLKYLILT